MLLLLSLDEKAAAPIVSELQPDHVKRLREALTVVQIERSAAELALGESALARASAGRALASSRHLAGMDGDNLLWQSYHAQALVAAARAAAPDADLASAIEAQRVRMLELARRTPDSTLARLNGSVAPERLPTLRLEVSGVVKRRLHSGHWRRRISLSGLNKSHSSHNS